MKYDDTDDLNPDDSDAELIQRCCRRRLGPHRAPTAVVPRALKGLLSSKFQST
jgi:hypothetical protein